MELTFQVEARSSNEDGDIIRVLYGPLVKMPAHQTGFGSADKCTLNQALNRVLIALDFESPANFQARDRPRYRPLQACMFLGCCPVFT